MDRIIFYAIVMPLAMIGALTVVVWSTSMPDYFGEAQRSNAEFRAKLDAASEIEWAKSVLAMLDKQEHNLAEQERQFNALAASTSCPLHIRLALVEMPGSYKLLAIERIGLRLDAKSIAEENASKDTAPRLKEKLQTYKDNLNRHFDKLQRLTAHLTKRHYGVTMDAYNAIRTGMSLSEVEQVIGPSCPPKEISRAGSFVTYVWGDKSGGIVAAFDGDRLVSKSQLGL